MGNSWLMITAIAIALIGSPVTAQAKCAKVKVKRPGEVYLVRGLANIFSLGLDTSAKQYSKMGIRHNRTR